MKVRSSQPTSTIVNVCSIRPGTARLQPQLSDEIRQTHLHDLKLQTHQIKQQTTILKTQIQRTEKEIGIKTTTITKTLQGSPDKRKQNTTTIQNLKRNIEGARHSLESLRSEIEAIEKGDSIALVEELEEDLKMNFCEYQRLVYALEDKQSEATYYERQLRDTEHRISSQNIAELRAMIQEIRAENTSLRSKANAYQVKIEKVAIESEIAENVKAQTPLARVTEQAQVDRKAQNEQILKTQEQLDNHKCEHQKVVSELTAIIEEMKQKIANRIKNTV